MYIYVNILIILYRQYIHHNVSFKHINIYRIFDIFFFFCHKVDTKWCNIYVKLKLIKCIEPDDVYIQYRTYHNTLHFQGAVMIIW